MEVVVVVEEANRRNEVKEAVRGAAMPTSARRDLLNRCRGHLPEPKRLILLQSKQR